MKLNENYILKNIAGTAVVVPVGDAVNDVKGMITLNGPAEIIWKGLQNGENIERIVEEIKSEYDAPENVIKNDVAAFLDKLKAVVQLFSARKQAKKIVKEFNPDIVIGFGGYVSAPVLMAAQSLGIKTMMHEQNSIVGKANLLLKDKEKRSGLLK